MAGKPFILLMTQTAQYLLRFVSSTEKNNPSILIWSCGSPVLCGLLLCSHHLSVQSATSFVFTPGNSNHHCCQVDTTDTLIITASSEVSAAQWLHAADATLANLNLTEPDCLSALSLSVISIHMHYSLIIKLQYCSAAGRKCTGQYNSDRLLRWGNMYCWSLLDALDLKWILNQEQSHTVWTVFRIWTHQQEPGWQWAKGLLGRQWSCSSPTSEEDQLRGDKARPDQHTVQHPEAWTLRQDLCLLR